jgi:hypothetical protein
MSKIDKVKMFNQILESLIIQLSPIIGTTHHNNLKIVLKMNAILPIKEFLIQVLPVQHKIINCDESFFDNADAHTDVLDENKNHLHEIIRLQNIYKKLDAESKKNAWQMFQAMLVLALEYNSM